MPHLLLVEQLSLLNSSSVLQDCQSGKCRPEKLLQNLVLLRAQAAQGLLIPLMNSYRLERILFSVWGHILTPSSLDPAAWQNELQALQAFFWGSPPTFAQILQNQMYFSQSMLFDELPESLGEIKIETGDENVWADSLPQQLYQTLTAMPQIQRALQLSAPLSKPAKLTSKRSIIPLWPFKRCKLLWLPPKVKRCSKRFCPLWILPCCVFASKRPGDGAFICIWPCRPGMPNTENIRPNWTCSPFS